MTKVIHHFVDKDGYTHIDEFNSSIPLDMGDVPDEYHVVLVTKSNSKLLSILFKECDTGRHDKRLMIGCPASGSSAIGYKSFDDARDAVRRFCFENPHPVKGGLREATSVDYTNAELVSIHSDLCKQIKEKSFDKSQSQAANPTQADLAGIAIKSAREVLDSAAKSGVLIASLAAHPLWKRVSWIKSLSPFMLVQVIGELVDPTWYVNPDRPDSSGFFNEYCGIYNPVEATLGQHFSTGIWRILTNPVVELLRQPGELTVEQLEPAGFWFLRHGLSWMQYHLSNGVSAADSMNYACWYHNLKLANFLWLNWMEVTHGSRVKPFDEERFFYGDSSAINAFCSAAGS